VSGDAVGGNAVKLEHGWSEAELTETVTAAAKLAHKPVSTMDFPGPVMVCG
jgi:hypothetical protein